MQLVELQNVYVMFRKLGAEVVAISTDSAANAERMVQEQGIEFPVLNDTDTSVSRAWRVFDLLDDERAAPATFVIDATGDLAFWKIGQNLIDRPSPGDILAAVQDLVREGSA